MPIVYRKQDCLPLGFMFSSAKKLGIVGGGQLGKMMLYHTRKWDVYTKVLDPSVDAPSRLACNEFVQGSLTDFDTLYNFGKDCEYLTIEIENVNANALAALEAEGVKVSPQSSSLKVIQDKGLQKQFYAEHKYPTAPFSLKKDKSEILQSIEGGEWAYPFVQKSRLAGYDGKGVAVIRDEKSLAKLMDCPSVLEKLVDIKYEIAVVAARNPSGEVVSYDPVLMEFNEEANLLDLLLFPAPISRELSVQAKEMAQRLIAEMDVCGLLAVEFFVDQDDKLIVNEVAPRPHNSGHQTIESCITDQYEMHLRAVMNCPLGSTECHIPSAMVNVLGAASHEGDVVYTGVEELMRKEGVHVHIYGKKQTRPFRKMGHITVTNTNLDQAKENALWAKEQLKSQS